MPLNWWDAAKRRIGGSVVTVVRGSGWWATSSNSPKTGALCALAAAARTNPRRSSFCRSCASSAMRILRPRSRVRLRPQRAAAADACDAARRRLRRMSPNSRRRASVLPIAMLLGVALAGCSSIGDFGRLKPSLVNDDIHDWVGQEAGARAGAPISAANLTDDERTLRDLAFPLIEPSYDRQRWNAVVYEYGLDHKF